jgi:hypothetical protein
MGVLGASGNSLNCGADGNLTASKRNVTARARAWIVHYRDQSTSAARFFAICKLALWTLPVGSISRTIYSLPYCSPSACL